MVYYAGRFSALFHEHVFAKIPPVIPDTRRHGNSSYPRKIYVYSGNRRTHNGITDMENGSGEIVLLTTLTDSESAAEFARALVEARLAACATVLPEARSFYRWGTDAIQDDRESVLLIKTHREKLAELEEFFRAHHPYDCPEFVVLDIAGLSPAYRDWLRRELRPQTGVTE